MIYERNAESDVESSNNKKVEVPVWHKITLTKEEAAAYSHIGLNKLEEMLKHPLCPFVLYVGKKKLVKRIEFEKYISEHIEL